MPDPKQSNSVDGFISLPSLPQHAKKRSASYPAYTLHQAEELAKVVFELGARNCNQDKVAQSANYSVNSGAFRSLRASANQFGLLQLGKNSYLSVSDEWIEIFHSEDPQLLKESRRKAILQPKLYKQLLDEYSGRQLPTLERLSRELHLNQKYGILKDAAETAARIFLESANYAGLVNEKGYLIDPDQNGYQTIGMNIKDVGDNREKEDRDIEHSQHEASEKLEKKSSAQKDSPTDATFPSIEGLEKYEITLINRKKAYIYVPVPLPRGEKERLKQYIDLILEETSLPDSKQDSSIYLEEDVLFIRE